MSRGALNDLDLLKMGDVLDWWTPAPPGPHVMRTLRDAVLAAASAELPTSLFRPPGRSGRAIWINAEQIARLALLFQRPEAPSQ